MKFKITSTVIAPAHLWREPKLAKMWQSLTQNPLSAKADISLEKGNPTHVFALNTSLRGASSDVAIFLSRHCATVRLWRTIGENLNLSKIWQSFHHVIANLSWSKVWQSLPKKFSLGTITKDYFASLVMTLLLFFLLPIGAYAQHFTSDSYIIEWGNFNMTAGKKTSTNYSLTDTVGQNAPGQYNSTGFVVKSGFQYIYDQNNKFSFSIDDLTIDFGVLIPGVATTATNIITVTTPSGHGYQIMSQENHGLAMSTGITIPDTSCNTNTCTISTSAIWNSPVSYGFGFNAIGINTSQVANGVGTSSYFTDSTYFRPFATGLQEQIIMSENLPVTDHSARITYKTNISTLQASGEYENGIIFTAVPKY